MFTKFFLLFAVAALPWISPCQADTESKLFRAAFVCSDQEPSSLCLFGTIPTGQPVTLLAKGWKSVAVPKEELPNTDSAMNIEKITRLQVTNLPSNLGFTLAVLAAPETVNELPLEEVQDEALVERIGRYIKKANELNLAPDIRVLKTRLLRLSPTILLSETFLARPDDVPALEKQLPTGCGSCDNVPLLIGRNFEDIFKEIRSKEVNVENTCGGIKLAFAVAGRTYIASHAFSCESDSFSADLVHDLSGQKPKLVFELSGGL